MAIASDLLRGHTDTIILTQLLCGDSYGYKINKAVATLTGSKHEFKEATLYSAFRRLEESGCITSYWGDETTGARRRYYRITETGKAMREALVKEWNEAMQMLGKLITPGGASDPQTMKEE